MKYLDNIFNYLIKYQRVSLKDLIGLLDKKNISSWYVKNDKEFNSNKLELNLTINNTKGENIIHSPVKKGLMIIRILVENKNQNSIDYYKSLQKSITIN